MGCSLFTGLETEKAKDIYNLRSIFGRKSTCVLISRDVLRKKLDQASKTGILNLQDCGLDEVPENCVKEGHLLAEIQTADLSVNRLITMPDTISTWAQLHSLNVEDNSLEALPQTIMTMVNLKKINVSFNRLTIIPEKVCEMDVTEIKAKGNKLLMLPDSFGGTISSSLLELDVSRNRLQILPRSLCCLKMLTKLMVQENRLTLLPLQARDAEGLSRLQYVDAASNSIGFIYGDTLLLPALSELWLSGNPIDRLLLEQSSGFAEFAERWKQCADHKQDPPDAQVVGDCEAKPSMCGLGVPNHILRGMMDPTKMPLPLPLPLPHPTKL